MNRRFAEGMNEVNKRIVKNDSVWVRCIHCMTFEKHLVLGRVQVNSILSFCVICSQMDQMVSVNMSQSIAYSTVSDPSNGLQFIHYKICKTIFTAQKNPSLWTKP